MSFLNPWLWLGALAIAAPVWLHLRARSGPVLRFPTLRFLEDQPPARARGYRLRDVLLFLLRAAAVLLLAGGFAWPFLPKSGPRVVESRVHLLDATLSRRSGKAFARDTARVSQALRDVDPEVQDAVVVLTNRPRVMVSFSDDPGAAAQQVAALEPSQARGSFVEALRLAQSMLSSSLGSRRRVLVYSDHQENQWKENETSPPFLEGVTVELADPPEVDSRRNVSLQHAAVRRFFLGEDAVVELTAELKHDGSFPGARLSVVSSGAQVFEKEVTLAAPGGTVTLHGQWRARADTWIRGEVNVDVGGDALAADDRVYFSLPPVREGRVALLARSPYLRAALGPAVMKGRWRTRRLDVAAGEVQALQSGDLPDVLVAEGDFLQSEAARSVVHRCLANQRGVVLFLDRVTPLLRGFLGELGFEAGGAAPMASEEAIHYVAGDHPLFRPFLNGQLGDLSQPRVFRHLRLSATRAAPLLFGSSGDPFLFESVGTRGRLLLFTFGSRRDDTDWPLLPSFVPFLDIALQHARQGTALETAMEPGALWSHEVPKDVPLPSAVALRAGTRLLQSAAPDPDGRRVRFEAPADPGLYEIAYDGGAPQAILAVNPSPLESELKYLGAPAAIAAWTIEARAPAAPAAPLYATARQQRWWWWVMVLGLAALLAETAVHVAARRRPA